MTIKTIMIAVALVVGFFTFLSVTWDISEWMLRDPSTITEKKPAKVQPVQSNTAASEQGTDTEKAETTDAQPDQTVLPGVYDDSWSGDEPVKAKTDTTKTPTANATTSPKPASQSTSGEGTTGDGSVTIPYASDDRENVEPEIDAGTSGSSNQDGDPYQPDERESN